jgi:hypothetical protein
LSLVAPPTSLMPQGVEHDEQNRGHSPLLKVGTLSTIMMACRELLAPRSVVRMTPGRPRGGNSNAAPDAFLPAMDRVR